jgi:hypothetical protein
MTAARSMKTSVRASTVTWLGLGSRLGSRLGFGLGSGFG